MIGELTAFLIEDLTICYSSSRTYLSSVKRQVVVSTRTTFFTEKKG